MFGIDLATILAAIQALWNEAFIRETGPRSLSCIGRRMAESSNNGRLSKEKINGHFIPSSGNVPLVQ